MHFSENLASDKTEIACYEMCKSFVKTVKNVRAPVVFFK